MSKVYYYHKVSKKKEMWKEKHFEQSFFLENWLLYGYFGSGFSTTKQIVVEVNVMRLGKVIYWGLNYVLNVLYVNIFQQIKLSFILCHIIVTYFKKYCSK